MKNTKFLRKMCAFAARHGLDMEPEKISVAIRCRTYEQYQEALAAAYRLKNVKIENLHHSLFIRIYDAADWQAWKESEQRRQQIVYRFWEAMRENGRDQKASQAAAHDLAVQIGALKEYEAIYA